MRLPSCRCEASFGLKRKSNQARLAAQWRPAQIGSSATLVVRRRHSEVVIFLLTSRSLCASTASSSLFTRLRSSPAPLSPALPLALALSRMPNNNLTHEPMKAFFFSKKKKVAPPRPSNPLGTTSVAVAAIDAADADASCPPVPSFASSAMGAPQEPVAVGVAAPAPEPSPADAGTKDAWVPRDPWMLRLTGRHPFNSEAPLDDLMASGFITKTALHFVRNHGAVPRKEWATHRVTIDVGAGADLNASSAAAAGAAAAAAAPVSASSPSSSPPSSSKPLVLSMDQIVALPARNLTVTMACAGNRRKEQNMHKKSQGFNWGAAAVSTATWTGVLLRDLLLLAGLDESDPLNATRHVLFCRPAGELPKGSDGRYGSSIALPYALNPANDVLVAYKQNGRWLAPDHGFPVRLILPGHIGGRTVKWLERVEVSDSESDNWYHYHDNRVLPPHIRTPEEAEAGGYWRNPDYIINHLNINSAISSPSHDAVVPLSLGGRAKIPFRGYAYSGGGRKVTSCLHRALSRRRQDLTFPGSDPSRRTPDQARHALGVGPLVRRHRAGRPARRLGPQGRGRDLGARGAPGARSRAPGRRRVDELSAGWHHVVPPGNDGQPALPRQDARV